MTLESALLALKTEDPVWAIAPDHLHGLADRLQREASLPARRNSLPPVALTTAVIPIIGPLTRRASFISEILGLSTYDTIRASLKRAVADKSIGKIVLFIDSPGGAVTGCEETAAAVAAAARIKPVTAYCDGLIASAAFWVGSQANEIVITPSGEAGSIGVIALHVEVSEALSKAGIKPTFLLSKVSPRKADLNAYEKLDPAAKVRALQQIDEIAAGFVRAVARGRMVSTGHVAENFGRGDTLLSAAARSAGMVDRVATFEAIVAESGQGPSDRLSQILGGAAQRAEAIRRRLVLEAMR